MSDFGFYTSPPISAPNLRFPQIDTYNVLTPPEELPITLLEVKEQLRLDPDDTSQDSYLTLLIEAARDYFECETNRILISTQFELLYSLFTQSKELRRSRINTLNAFQYKVDGVFTDVDPTTYYSTFESNYSLVIIPDILDLPTDKDDVFQSIRIDFNAGYGIDSSFVPADIRMTLLEQVTWLYENRGDCNTCDMCSSLSAFANSVYKKYRIITLYGASYRGG